MSLRDLSTEKYRWVALVFIALGLAIVIIDNTVLNVAIPYILRDLHASFDSIQWVVSGYSLIIATLLITMGRLGDFFGRKKVFLTGVVFFATGSFIASISPNVTTLFLGEALIEAIGASMMLTSALAIIADEFRGKERAIAFGIWGSIAGASASLGPLLGGYLTTYYSWRWSFRINVIVAIVALMGSVFVKASKGEHGKGFDWKGTFYSGVGLFAVVFSFIEGRKYGWWVPGQSFTFGNFTWPLGISIIPFTFLIAVVSLYLFIKTEKKIEDSGGSPLLRMSIFENRGFSIGLLTLMVVSFGQFGVFFILPIFLQNALGLDAFGTGLILLFTSVSVFIFGPLSGFIASKIHPKWLVNTGMVFFSIGTIVLIRSISVHATGLTLAPALILFGVGIGMASSQLTNIIVSSISVTLAGEASAVSATMRQVGSSIGSAVVGMVLASSLTAGIATNIQSDNSIPSEVRQNIIGGFSDFSTESLQSAGNFSDVPPAISRSIKNDIDLAMARSAKSALSVAVVAMILGALISFYIPVTELVHEKKGMSPKIEH